MDGLSGSGSQDVVVKDLFVPECRMLTDVSGILSGQSLSVRDYPEPVFRMPLITFASFVASVPILGAARRLVEIARQTLPSRQVKGSQMSLGENPAAQVRLARADTMVSTAEQVLRNVGRRGMDIANLEGPEQVPARIRLRAEAAFAVKLCRDAAFLLCEGAGSHVHRLEQPFQRLVRDLNVMASHLAFDADTSNELHGRQLVGLAPNSFIF
jgi:alkylation response protein AidB-like acyl-CoA dehydrogenase